MPNGWPKNFDPSKPRWPDMEKNKEIWKNIKQKCANCKKKIPNPEFYDHITKNCPMLQIPYIDLDGLKKVMGIKRKNQS